MGTVSLLLLFSFFIRMMKTFKILLSFVFSILTAKVNCQNNSGKSGKWLDQEMVNHQNLMVLNTSGYQALGSIINRYKPQSLILGYCIKDSFFVFNPEDSTTVESCSVLLEKRMKNVTDSVMAYCQFYPENLMKPENFSQRKPVVTSTPTFIILYSQSFRKKHRKFIRQVQENSIATGMRYILLFTDYPVDD